VPGNLQNLIKYTVRWGVVLLNLLATKTFFGWGHKPKTMSEIYSHLFEEIDMRLAEAGAVGFGFDLRKNPPEKAVVAPIAPRFKTDVFQEVAVSA
jgi:hypothetical protein